MSLSTCSQATLKNTLYLYSGALRYDPYPDCAFVYVILCMDSLIGVKRTARRDCNTRHERALKTVVVLGVPSRATEDAGPPPTLCRHDQEKQRTNGRALAATDWSSHQLGVPAPLQRLHLLINSYFFVKNDYELDLRLIDI
jgi:hypothetical protein